MGIALSKEGKDRETHIALNKYDVRCTREEKKKKLNYSCSISAPYVKHSLLMFPISPTFLPKLDEKQIHYLKDICLKFPFCALAIWDLQLSLPILLVIAPTTANNAFIKQNLLIYLFVFLYYFYYLGIK